MGGLPAAALAGMRGIARVFALAFAALTAVRAVYLFFMPVAVSAAITVCLVVAARLSPEPAAC